MNLPPESEYSYPYEEHLEPLQTRADYIRDEMHYGGEGEEFRQRISRELGTMYDHSNLVFSLRGGMMSLAQLEVDDERAWAHKVDTLHLGTLLGVHAELKAGAMNQVMRRKVLATLNSGAEYEAAKGRHLRQLQVGSELKLLRMNTNMLLQDQTRETKDALFDAANQLVIDRDLKEQDEEIDDVMFAYLYTSRSINAIKRRIYRREGQQL